MRRPLAIALGVVLLAGTGWLAYRMRFPDPVPPAAPLPGPALSPLAAAPDWSRLDAYQNSITRAEFEDLLTNVFTVGDGWRQLIAIDDTGANIATGNPPPHDRYRLAFRSGEPPVTVPRYWHSAAEMPPALPGKPLDGVRVAIDPGHIGGNWAATEERDLTVPGRPPVREGDLTLAVARLLKPRLEAMGATVFLVRDGSEPVTPLRPADLLPTARATLDQNPEISPQKLADRLFYRTAEIHARADLVNQTIKPDLVLCLHFNADAWGPPDNPAITQRSHFHLLVNGAYGEQETALADQRFSMLLKLLQDTHAEEAAIAGSVAPAMAAANGLPPFVYQPGSGKVRAIPGQPYVWARNLLANRLYECPVLYTEPYVMNSADDYERIQAGVYEGTRIIGGKARPSILREYADSLAAGLADHFRRHRPGRKE